MKRVIKFWGNYSDEFTFSNCSTYYEVLPVLVADDAGLPELKAVAKKFGIKLGRQSYERTKDKKLFPYQRNSTGFGLTHSIKTMEVRKQDSGVYLRGEIKERIVYLGLIQLPNTENAALQPVESIGNKVTKDQASEIVCDQDFGVSDVATIDDTVMIIMKGWDYFHIMPMLGYDLESFQQALGVKDKSDRTFSDEVSSCHECGAWDHNDDGYNQNFRVVQECTLLGINCGCYEEYCQSDDAIEAYADQHDQCMELAACESLVEAGKLKFVERFIGGWTDGRGGYFNGEATREGKPADVLKELKAKNPRKRYLFSHDESGQFQQYFSVWEILNKGTKRKAG